MKVAVLGFGTVGYGVYDMLSHAEGLEQGPVLVRPGKVDAPFKVSSMEELLADPQVGAVAEVMGGVEPAFSYVSQALKAGKHVVTSNKALVAAKGVELQALASENHCAFLFSAACGGGVPFLHNLALARESDEIENLGGILNGTTNYMLDAMQSRDMDYADALKDAQALGFAEADPTADVSGADALRKIMLACAVAYDMLPNRGLNTEGIESFSGADVAHLKELGLTCRLLAKGGKNADGSLFAYVEPCLFPASAPECSVLRNFNMAKYFGKCAGSIVMIGQGAGRWPTASAVLRDLSDILHGRRQMLQDACRYGSADNAGCRHSYYVRTDASCAGAFPVRQTYVPGERLLTEPMSVQEMHRAASDIREKGGSIFFAAVEE